MASAVTTARDGFPSATYIQRTSQGNLTFALSAVNDTGDTFIHLSGPTAYQWIAIGTGSRMRGSVMLIVYKNETGGKSMTCLPARPKLRQARHHTLAAPSPWGDTTKLQFHHRLQVASGGHISAAQSVNNQQQHVSFQHILGRCTLHKSALARSRQRQNLLYRLEPALHLRPRPRLGPAHQQLCLCKHPTA